MTTDITEVAMTITATILIAQAATLVMAWFFMQFVRGPELYADWYDDDDDETRPCIYCDAPVDASIHEEELGMCLECSNAYWEHCCRYCGSEDIDPYTNRCNICNDLPMEPTSMVEKLKAAHAAVDPGHDEHADSNWCRVICGVDVTENKNKKGKNK